MFFDKDIKDNNVNYSRKEVQKYERQNGVAEYQWPKCSRKHHPFAAINFNWCNMKGTTKCEKYKHCAYLPNKSTKGTPNTNGSVVSPVIFHTATSDHSQKKTTHSTLAHRLHSNPPPKNPGQKKSKKRKDAERY